MRFDDRLRGLIGTVLGMSALAGCDPAGSDTGGGTDTSGPDLSGMCDGAAPPTDFQVAQGFVTVDPGTDCPAAEDAEIQVLGCTFLEWQDITCGLSTVEHDQVFVNNGYGGEWRDEATATSGTYVTVDPTVVDVCWYDAVFYLDPDHPTCGRPLLCEGRMVVADARPGPTPWATERHPVVADLSAAERAEIGGYWLQAAMLEHASIASFSVFALELLRFGAPPALLEAAHEAARDEMVHAKLCFSLASGYRGAPVGPGELGAAGLPPGAASLLAFAEALVREGCIGETLAAVDAAARLAGARDGAVRAALAVIVRDESAHARLAWRTLAWVLSRDADGAIRRHLDAVFAEEGARWSAEAEAGEASRTAQAHGLLGGAARASTLAQAWSAVIAPAWAAV
jgi:hypothetical protein